MNWTRQPPTRQGINWGNPLAAGLKVAISPSFGPVEVISNKHANQVSTALGAKVPTQAGMAWSPTDQALGGVEFTAYRPLLSGDKTVFAICNPRTAAKQKRLLSIRSSGGNDDLCFAFNVSAASQSSGSWNLFEYRSGSIGWSAAATMATGLHAYGATRSSNAGTMFIDGAAVSATVSGTQYITDGLDYRLAIANAAYFAGTTLCFDDPFVLVLAWQRALSAREHAQLSANPWQVFAPLPSRVYSFPSSVAYLLSVSASTATAASSVRSIAATKTASKATGASMVRAVGATRSATSTATPVMARVIAAAKSASGACSATLARALTATKSATAACGAVIVRSASVTRSATASCSAAIARTAAVSKSASTTASTVVVRSVSAVRSSTSTPQASIARALTATKIATQASTATMVRSLAKTLSASVSALAGLIRAVLGTIFPPSNLCLVQSTLSAVLGTNSYSLPLAARPGATIAISISALEC